MASREQAEGAGQLNKNVSEMDRITQQTAANAEEAASASEELDAQSRKMQKIVEGLVGLIGGKS